MKSHKGFAKGYLIVLIFLVILLLGIGYLFRDRNSKKTNEVSGSVTVKPTVTVKKTTPKKTTSKKTVVKSPTTPTPGSPQTSSETPRTETRSVGIFEEVITTY